MTYPENDILPQESMKRILKERARLVEEFLNECQKNIPGTPELLARAMSYSLEAGGKRIRPVLCLSCASLCGLAAERALPFAAAIEMVHTYSLIHDDLPAMDNDDLRRGKPSNHKAFGEAAAILAGDGLLSDAFFVISGMDLVPAAVLAALRELALASGSSGMVGGQMLDMEYTGKDNVTEEELARMQALKTGAILRASCLCGALLAQAGESLCRKISDYGQELGSAFQIADDILDVVGDSAVMGKPVGNDENAGKNTWPSLVGLEESRRLANERKRKAIAALDGLEGEEAAFLRALAIYTVERVN